jgi:hypothetical protein
MIPSSDPAAEVARRSQLRACSVRLSTAFPRRPVACTDDQVTKDYRNFYGLRLAEQPRVEPYQQRVVDSWMDST